MQDAVTATDIRREVCERFAIRLPDLRAKQLMRVNVFATCVARWVLKNRLEIGSGRVYEIRTAERAHIHSLPASRER